METAATKDDGTGSPQEKIRGLVQRKMTFVDALRSGDARSADVDDWVDFWHADSNSNSVISLRELLGLSSVMYAEWMRGSSAPFDIVLTTLAIESNRCA